MESKCPVCQRGYLFIYEEHRDGGDTAGCSYCAFGCEENDIPRISAAMELARAQYKRMTTNPNFLGEWDNYDEALHKAKRGVLEVFGGE